MARNTLQAHKCMRIQPGVRLLAGTARCNVGMLLAMLAVLCTAVARMVRPAGHTLTLPLCQTAHHIKLCTKLCIRQQASTRNACYTCHLLLLVLLSVAAIVFPTAASSRSRNRSLCWFLLCL